jgi:hypothetical protein
MAVALSTLLIGGREYQAGEELPTEVLFAGRSRPVDVGALVKAGLAENPKPKARAKKETDDA